ncbi:MAG TPA: hypothetical protein VM491_02460 [Burkholderiaceae bacterium]|jgi:hypothetical protein|nr:hypothetical protein [Burkholderiaceae bacterium]
MRLPALWTVIAIAATPYLASAQTPQPYAGLEARPIKALSDQQIADLKAGRGLGLALAAELNGYPGPLHVLELADSLGLSQAQREKMRGLFESMKTDTMQLGEKLIALEADLDRQFAGKAVTAESLRTAVEAIGATQASLRAAHLGYHLATVEVLSPAQIARYAELRGYKEDARAKQPHIGHRH